MKKNFKFMILALVAMCGFASCSEECEHEFIAHDFTQDIVGTWTSLNGELAEAMVIKEDGTFTTTGIMQGGSLYEEKGTIKVVNNKVTLAFDGDKETFEGRLEFVAGKSLSIVMFDDNDVRLTYDYCENDLSDEIVGMWVCNDAPADGESEMMINTFYENGKSVLTGFLPLGVGSEQVVNNQTDYKVVGDLLFITIPADRVGGENPMYIARQIIYTPNATAMGDIMTRKTITGTSSWLRIKQHLELENQKYDYIKTFVSNVKGEDKDIDFMGYTFNFAKMDGSGLDKMLKALLFAVEFPDANTLGYSYQMNGNKETYNSPIVVEGNKMTIKMSAKVPTLKDVVLYAFQDADCSQMHFYMHKTAFVNFYTNMQAMLMEATDEQFDINNAEAVNAIYDNINNAVETINVSLVMSK